MMDAQQIWKIFYNHNARKLSRRGNPRKRLGIFSFDYRIIRFLSIQKGLTFAV